MLRISKLSDYAIVLLTVVVNQRSEHSTALELSALTRIAEPTVKKLLKQLTAAGLLRSVRGRHGGYMLARSPSQIAVTQILEAVEGPVALTECTLLDGGDCGIETDCSMRDHWKQINQAIRLALDQVTLAQLTTPQAQPLRRFNPGESQARRTESKPTSNTTPVA